MENIKQQSQKQPYDEYFLHTDARALHYQNNEEHINVKNGLLARKHLREASGIKQKQVLKW